MAATYRSACRQRCTASLRRALESDSRHACNSCEYKRQCRLCPVRTRWEWTQRQAQRPQTETIDQSRMFAWRESHEAVSWVSRRPLYCGDLRLIARTKEKV